MALEQAWMGNLYIVRDINYFLAASEPKNCEKIAVSKSAASVASAKEGSATVKADLITA